MSAGPEDLVVARGLDAAYGGRRPLNGARVVGVKALSGVDVRIGRSETVGIVGESGCGKTTLGRALLRLIDVEAGSIVFDGVEISRLSDREMRPLRRRMQMIFQDPMTSLTPRHTVRRILVEPLLFHRVARDTADRARRIRQVFDRVALPLVCLDRTPHEISADSGSASASPAPRCLTRISFSPTRSSPGSTYRRRRRRSIS